MGQKSKLIEGLIISRQLYQERHLLATILPRKDEAVSVLFYGGRGGGKTKVSDELDLGSMIQMVYEPPRSSLGNSDFLGRAKEWNSLWRYQKLRQNYSLYMQMSHYLKLIKQFPLQGEEVFNLVSNAIYSLELGATQGALARREHFFLFMAKLVALMGIFPELGSCILCSESFLEGEMPSVLAQKGGFACENCLGSVMGFSALDSGKMFYGCLKKLPYFSFRWTLSDEAVKGNGPLRVETNTLEQLVNYFDYYFPLKERSFHLQDL